MRGGLRALLDSTVDYAGLFPPAALDMPAAVENYARYREGRHAWMLSHFICPVTRLDEFDRAAGGWSAGADPAWTMSLLGRAEGTAEAFTAALERDLAAVAALEEKRRGRLEARALEIRLPAPLDREPERLGAFVDGVAAAIEGRLPALDQLFLEIAPEGGDLPALFAAIGAARARLAPRTLGVKIRTGGVEATAFPATATVARFVALARDAGLPFKATAGLHHPLRRFDEPIGATMHGFLNLFAGAVLLFAGALDEAELVRVLDEEDPEAFRFGEDTVTWRGRSCAAEEVQRARRHFALSFGSCSFTEPLDDLDALGLL